MSIHANPDTIGFFFWGNIFLYTGKSRVRVTVQFLDWYTCGGLAKGIVIGEKKITRFTLFLRVDC